MKQKLTETNTINLRLPKRMLGKLALIARNEGISRTELIKTMLKIGLEKI
jgi:metal-responsive CopG/Arc/MetJ family transcriptional regulator